MEGVPSGPSRGPAFKGRPPSTATPPTAPRARTSTAARGRGLRKLVAGPPKLILTAVQLHPQDREQPLHFRRMCQQDLEVSTDTKTGIRVHQAQAQSRWTTVVTVTLVHRIGEEETNSGGI